jgi:hypothetical protein
LLTKTQKNLMCQYGKSIFPKFSVLRTSKMIVYCDFNLDLVLSKYGSWSKEGSTWKKNFYKTLCIRFILKKIMVIIALNLFGFYLLYTLSEIRFAGILLQQHRCRHHLIASNRGEVIILPMGTKFGSTIIEIVRIFIKKIVCRSSNYYSPMISSHPIPSCSNMSNNIWSGWYLYYTISYSKRFVVRWWKSKQNFISWFSTIV